jgi:phosphohistidine swiveling domain-containing protein
MAKLYTDSDKFESDEGPVVVEAFHSALKDLVRTSLDRAGVSWKEFVFGKEFEYLTPDAIAAIERSVVESGYRYQTSAVISYVERPDAYTPIAGADATSDSFSFEHAEAVTGEPENGRAQRGQGDNVARYPENVVGTARYYRSIDDVMTGLREGVPAGTVAIIDDSGGTLTAPIIEQFSAIVCAGGTVRSHLGILTREYGIPCLMNSKINGIRNGDTIEVGVSGAAKTTEAYQRGVEMSVPVWKHTSSS